MKLFSKRHTRRDVQRENIRDLQTYRSLHRSEFIKTELRNRIVAEIAFSTSRDDFLEFFILFEDQKKEKKFLDQGKIDGFSLIELGYKMSEYFQFEDFAMNQFEIPSRSSRSEENKDYCFDDFKLFDLIEILILFSKKDSREDLIKRFNYIFSEEGGEYEILNGMIIRKNGENINTIKHQLKDLKLQSKLDDYQYYYDRNDFINTSKITAEILNIIFSDLQQEKKKNKIEEILDDLSKQLICDSKQKEDFKVKIGSMLEISKYLCNNIYNIRHTEKSTIQIVDDNIFLYKLVSSQNIAFIELILMTLKNDYIASEDWEQVKNDYIAKYQINKNQRFVRKKPTYDDDLPF